MNSAEPILSSIQAPPIPGGRMTPPTAPMAENPRQNTPGIGIPGARPKKPQPVPLQRIREGEFVQAVANWLEGDPWTCNDRCFRPYLGLAVRLIERDGQLTEGGLPILSRDPMALHSFAPGTITSNRIDAFALCARAVRLLGGQVPTLLVPPSA